MDASISLKISDLIKLQLQKPKNVNAHQLRDQLLKIFY
jgi:hypothetical protein